MNYEMLAVVKTLHIKTATVAIMLHSILKIAN